MRFITNNHRALLWAFTASISFCLSVSLHAQAQKQQPSKQPIETIEPTYVSISSGLASPTVNNVIQDSFGLIWIATNNGLQRYDGYRFETFKNIPGKPTSLQHNDVWALMEDDDHNIWVGTELGISRYDRRRNEFKNYLFPGYFNTALGAPYGLTLRIIQDSQKNIYAATRYLGLLKYIPSIDNWKYVTYKVPGVDAPDHFDPSISITEDAKGVIWFGSMVHGLMYRTKSDSVFTTVQDDQLNKFKGTVDAITAIFIDSTYTLWITSRNGIYKYCPETKKIRTIKSYEPSILNPTFFNAIVQDKQGNVWISNNLRGILKFDGITDHYTEIEIAGKVKMRDYGWNTSLSNFILDQSGIFWFSTQESGLMKYNRVSKPFQHLKHDANNKNSLSAGSVFGITASKINPGVVYVGKRGTGIDVYDSKTQAFRNINFKAEEDMFGGSARSLAEKPDGSLWLGTWGDGIVELDKNYKEVKRYKYDSTSKKSLSHNQVRVLKYDKQGRLWVGTNSGLNILTPQSGAVQRISNKEGKQYPEQLVKELDKLILSDQKIGVIDKVTDNQDKALPITIKTAGTYWVMVVAEMDAVSSADYGWIENDKKDTVWRLSRMEKTLHAGGDYKNRMEIGSVELQPGSYTLRYRTDDSHAYGKWNAQPPDMTSLYGIALIQPKQNDQLQILGAGQMVPEREELLSSGSNIMDVEMTDQYAWVAAEGSGLDRIDLATNHLKNYSFNPDDENSLSNNNIKDIFVDSRGMIWLATNQGVNKFDPSTETFTRYTDTDGLPTNLTEGILQGDDGEMWIATQNGLAQMITNEALNKVTFINYNSTDGLGTDVFLALTNVRASDGKFYFGGEHGLTTFNTIASNKTPPSIIISNLFISNKSVMDMKEDSPLTQSLLETKSLTLPYNQNSLSFEFAALHYANPQKNQYAHMLKGYDQDWIYDNRNYAAYTNLDPGKYEFLIRASNAYGVWNEKGTALEIIILPPWWRTWWAFAGYGVLFFGLIYTTYFGMRTRIKIRERERGRQKELQHAKAIEKAYTELKATQAQLVQSEKMASLGELTAGIAHEIQNPLNFVNNFSEVSNELIKELQDEKQKPKEERDEEVEVNLLKDIAQNLEKINHHGKRADAIVKGMLQHSQSSNGAKIATDINALADEYLRLSYHGLRAKDKSFNATMKTDFDDSIKMIDVVSQDIGRVILNILTNAFYAVNEKKKQQPYGYEPSVSIQTKKRENQIEINITDNGNGVPQQIIDKIFQPFFTTKPTGQGTGLGLSLSYDIITKGHGGELKVTTSSNGSTFTILLPA